MMTMVHRTSDNLPPPPRLYAYDAKRGLKRWLTKWKAPGRSNFHTRTFGYSPGTTEQQALRRYQSWLEQWKARAHVRSPKGDEARFTIASLAGRYLRHASRTFVKNGRATSHVGNVRYAMRALRGERGSAASRRPADAVGAPEIAVLRDGPLLFTTDGKARALKTVNQRLTIVKDAFAWARERGLVSAATLADVRGVKRLRKGRSAAKDPKKVRPVADETVEVTMKAAPRVIRDMVELLRLTGMRPGEACSMRGNQVEAGGDVWLYRPGASAKLEHMEDPDGRLERVVCLGPRAQDIVKRYLRPDLSAYLFSPAEAHGQRLAERRDGRKTKLWPSHAKRHVPEPTANLADHYEEKTFRKAIHYACRKAGVNPPWHPNQLRHTAATSLRKKYGLEGSRVVLGHTNLTTTQLYAERDVRLAMQIAREVG